MRPSSTTWCAEALARKATLYRRRACHVPEHDNVGARQLPCAADVLAWPEALMADEPATKSTATPPDRETLPDPERSTPGGVTMRPCAIISSDEKVPQLPSRVVTLTSQEPSNGSAAMADAAVASQTMQVIHLRKSTSFYRNALELGVPRCSRVEIGKCLCRVSTPSFRPG
jgi:hypothetical protein